MASLAGMGDPGYKQLLQLQGVCFVAFEDGLSQCREDSSHLFAVPRFSITLVNNCREKQAAGWVQLGCTGWARH
eukprot:10628384-Heterocapsa_arctica.AAC.1